MKKKKKKKQWIAGERVKLSPAREEMLAQQALKSDVVDELKKKNRCRLELWFDRHNHVMEFLRTFFALVTVTLQVIILGKLFNLF